MEGLSFLLPGNPLLLCVDSVPLCLCGESAASLLFQQLQLVAEDRGQLVVLGVDGRPQALLELDALAGGQPRHERFAHPPQELHLAGVLEVIGAFVIRKITNVEY